MNTAIIRHSIITAILLLTAGAGAWGQIPAADLARMEEASPSAASVEPDRPRRLLVYTLSQGYVHTSIERASAALQIMARKTGAFEVVISADSAVFAPATLQQFDAVCFNNTTHLAMGDPAMRQSLLAFVRNGGGLVGLHAGVDNFYSWPEAQEMFGGYFDGHPWTADGTWAVTVEDRGHPLTAAFGGKDFTINDELYRIAPVNLRTNCRVLLRIDSRDPHNRTAKGMRATDRDLPVSWIRTYGKGRVFYCSLGHNDGVFWNPPVMRHYLDGIQYALGDLPADATPRPFDPMIMFDADSLRVLLGQIAAHTGGSTLAPLLAFDAFVRDIRDIPAARARIEQEMLLTLERPVTPEGKHFLCQRLAELGSAAAVPALTGMLASDATFAMAVYALEGIPGTEAELALLGALDRAAGAPRIRIINALGSRRAAAAVPPLQGIVTDADAAAASAAAHALGRIGTMPALEALRTGLTRAPGALRQDIMEGMLTAAGIVAATGNRAAALEVYRSLQADGTPVPVRAAALRALIRDNGPDAMDAVTAAIRGSDDVLRTAALQSVQDMPTGDAVRTIAGMLPTLPATGKVQLLTALARHPDAAVRRTVTDGLRDRSEEVRTAAARTLGKIGDATSVRPLVTAATLARGTEQRTVRESLAGLGAPGAEDTLALLAAAPAENIRTEAIRAMRERRVPATVGTLLGALKDRSAKVRQEAALALRALAGSEHMEVLVGHLTAEKNDGVRKELENTIVAAAGRISDEAARDRAVADAYGDAKNKEVRMSLLRVLGRIGTPRAYELLVPVLREKDRDIMLTAVRALADWPTPAAYNELLALSTRSKDRTVRVLAARGAVRMTGLDTTLTEEEALRRYRAAFGQTKDLQEKKQLLALLGAAPSKAGFMFAAEFLDDRDLKTDAELAVATCAEGIVYRAGGSLAPVLQRLRSSSDPVVADKAYWLLHTIERMEDYVTLWQYTGPYEARGASLFDHVFAPETADAAGVEWKPFPHPSDPADRFRLALDRVIGGTTRVAYLRTVVHARSAMKARLECGSDDGIKVWLNGTLVHANDAVRTVVHGQDRVPVALRQGANILMIKVVQNTDGWGASVRVRGADGGQVKGLRYTLVP